NVDDSGNAWVVGSTNSNNFKLANATQGTYGGVGSCFQDTPFGPIAYDCPDVFVSKLNITSNSSTLLYSTYHGGVGEDVGSGISVFWCYIKIAGSTSEIIFPVTAGAFQTTYGGGNYDAFITKIQDTVSKKVRAQVVSQ